MDGITILNEMGGGFDSSAMWGGIIIGIWALIFFVIGVYALFDGEGEVATGLCLLALILGIFSALLFSQMYPPKQYEVTLEPGAVIDATQWEIVEKRGEIYVLEAK